MKFVERRILKFQNCELFGHKDGSAVVSVGGWVKNSSHRERHMKLLGCLFFGIVLGKSYSTCVKK